MQGFKDNPVLRVARILYPVTTLGYGNRIGIWFQGCSLRCPGCISKDLWPDRGAKRLRALELLKVCEPWLACCDGITLTGGEPLEQEGGVAALCSYYHEANSGDIVLYTGFMDKELKEKAWIYNGQVDVLVPGPYDALAGQSKTMRGSDNQRIHLLTELARRRYPLDIENQHWSGDRKLDWFPVGETNVFAGIPTPGWGRRLSNGVHDRGFTFNSCANTVPNCLGGMS